MHFTLINAPTPHAPEGKYKSQIPTPVSLLQVGTALQSRGHDVELLNFLHDTHPPVPENTDAFVVNMSECSVMDNCLDHAVEYLRMLRFFHASTPIWLLGFYPWLHRDELQSQGYLVADPLFFEDEIADNESHSDYHPNWDLWNFDWSPVMSTGKRITIRASRGCPHRCFECPVFLIYKQRIRRFPVGWVLHEIDTLYHRYGIREIGFLDDNMFVDRKWGKALLREIISRKYKKLRFTFEEGLDVPTALDGELCGLLKQAGFYHIKLGVESFSPQVLDFIHKPYRKPETAIKAIKTLQSHGLNPTCFLCFGFPVDTEQDITHTIGICEQLGVKLRVQMLFPYPGLKLDPCPIPAKRLQQLKNEALSRTGSLQWRKS